MRQIVVALVGAVDDDAEVLLWLFDAHPAVYCVRQSLPLNEPQVLP